MSFFQNILSSLVKSTRRLNRFGSKGLGKLHNNIDKAVDSVMSTTGEVSTLVYAEHLLNLIEKENDEGLSKFLKNSFNFFCYIRSLVKQKNIKDDFTR